MRKLKYNQLKLRKKDDRYEIYDLPMGDFTFSVTRLYPDKATTGHTQEDKEVYYFIDGYGHIQVGEDDVNVEPGDIVVIPEGAFHRVFSTMYHLVFACAFPNEELMKARKIYDKVLTDSYFAGGDMGRAENDYSEAFVKHWESGGREFYGTSEGICKEAWEAREQAKKAWQEAGQRCNEAWENYINLKKEVI